MIRKKLVLIVCFLTVSSILFSSLVVYPDIYNSNYRYESSLTFNQTGLPAGTSWTLNITVSGSNGYFHQAKKSTNGNNITFTGLPVKYSVYVKAYWSNNYYPANGNNSQFLFAPIGANSSYFITSININPESHAILKQPEHEFANIAYLPAKNVTAVWAHAIYDNKTYNWQTMAYSYGGGPTWYSPITFQFYTGKYTPTILEPLNNDYNDSIFLYNKFNITGINLTCTQAGANITLNNTPSMPVTVLPRINGNGTSRTNITLTLNVPQGPFNTALIFIFSMAPYK